MGREFWGGYKKKKEQSIMAVSKNGLRRPVVRKNTFQGKTQINLVLAMI